MIHRVRITPPFLRMHAGILTLLLASTVSNCAGPGPSDTRVVEAPAYAELIAEARAFLQRVLKEDNLPGLSVAVARDGELIWSEAFGFADLEHRVPMTRETRSRIGSVSKAVTIGGLAKLVETGKLDLDAEVQQYVPTFPRKRWPITTRQLSGHQSGIRHYGELVYFSDEFLNKEHFPTVLDGLSFIWDDTLLFEPGTQMSYSSHGFNLISAVMEGASGQDFLTYMRDNVFEPLGMEHTVADHPDSVISDRAGFYEHTEEGGFRNAPYADLSYKWAGGGFLSTPEDLVRYGSAYLQPGFLRRETLDLLFTRQRLANGEETRKGIGWGVDIDEKGRLMWNHGGSSVGARANLAIYPEHNFVIAILVNLRVTPNPGERSNAIVDIFLN